MDSTMPGALSGKDLLDWLANHRPDAKGRVVVAFSSAEDPELRQMVEKHAMPYITKPFEVSELIAVTLRAMQAQKSVATV
jgi:CheY-like chemotaxis protein